MTLLNIMYNLGNLGFIDITSISNIGIENFKHTEFKYSFHGPFLLGKNISGNFTSFFFIQSKASFKL